MTAEEEYEHISAQLDQLGDELREFWARNERSIEELRAFNQQYFLRMDDLHKRSAMNLAQLKKESIERLEDMKAEGRAQREALFRVLDKLDGRDDEAA